MAKAIAKQVVDLELDIELVGRYLYRLVSRVAYNRFRIIAESAEYEKEQNERNYI